MHLAGRKEATLDPVAQRIRTDRDTAHVACVDVLDRTAVKRHASAVAAASGAASSALRLDGEQVVVGVGVPPEADRSASRRGLAELEEAAVTELLFAEVRAHPA